MASLSHFLFLSLLLQSIVLIKCDDTDEDDNLLQGINQYRLALNLTSLTKNDRAECLADELADQFRSQPCTNTSGPNTILGTEQQFSNFPDLLSRCHLNTTTTRDGQILPACIPGLVPGIVVSNFTMSRYSGYLNSTEYTGIGIGSEGSWIVAILTTNTPDGNYAPGTTPNSGASRLGGLGCVVLLVVGFFVL